MGGPLEGIKVVEMGVWIAGPAAGQVLGDCGADVVKIEPPGTGDPCRLLLGMLGVDVPINPVFEMSNRNKRGVVINTKTQEGLAVALDLIDQADVFISNMRMPALEKMGFDPESLMARNERLIYGHGSGYGLAGADVGKAAYDVGAYWSRSGVADIVGGGGEPLAQRGAFGDFPSGMNLAGGIAAALFARERTGQGQLVSTSLMRTAVYQLAWDYAILTRLGIPPAYAIREKLSPTVNCYQAGDGRWFWLLGLEGDRHWDATCRVTGRPDLAEDTRYATHQGRMQDVSLLVDEFSKVFATKTRDEWAEIFKGEPLLWWCPVNTLEEALGDPQLHAANCFTDVPDSGTTTMFPNTPIDFGGERVEQRQMAPEPGQHTDEVLAELGRSPEQIAALRKSGVVA